AAPQMAQPQPAAPTKGKALLPTGMFGRRSSQLANVAPHRTDVHVAVQSTAPPAKGPAASPKPVNEKALVPELMAIVARAKDAALETEPGDQVIAEPPVDTVPVSHVAPAI